MDKGTDITNIGKDLHLKTQRQKDLTPEEIKTLKEVVRKEFSKAEMTHYSHVMTIGLSVETQSRRSATFEATIFQAYIVTMATFK